MFSGELVDYKTFSTDIDPVICQSTPRLLITSFSNASFSLARSKSLHASSALNHLDHHHNDGDNQEDVNDSTQRIAADQSQQPQN